MKRLWTRWTKLTTLLAAVVLATYGCSGGDGGSVQTGGQTGGGAGGGTVQVQMSLANFRVVNPEIDEFILQIWQGNFPNVVIVLEESFVRDTTSNQQTLSVSGLDSGNYILRLLYRDNGVVRDMFQQNISVNGEPVVVQNPDYSAARNFTAVITSTAQTDFNIFFNPLAGGDPTLMEASPVGGVGAGIITGGIYEVASPLTATVQMNIQEGTVVTPPIFPVGPAITQTVEILIFDPTDATFVMLPRDGYTVTHTVGITDCPQPTGTYIFVNNSDGPVNVSPFSTSQFLTVTAPGGTDVGDGFFQVPGNGTLNIVTEFNCLTSFGTILTDVQGFVDAGTFSTTVGAPLRVNIVGDT